MTTRTTTPSTTPATGLRGARAEQAKAKAAAKKAPETPAFKVTMAERRAPAKKAPAAKSAPAAKTTPAKKAAAPAGEKRTFTATGRCGAVRTTQSTATEMFAVDVAQPGSPSEKARQGRVFAFFATEAAAEKPAAKTNATGDDAIVVKATVVAKAAVA
jgi:hypothetical protein